MPFESVAEAKSLHTSGSGGFSTSICLVVLVLSDQRFLSSRAIIPVHSHTMLSVVIPFGILVTTLSEMFLDFKSKGRSWYVA